MQTHLDSDFVDNEQRKKFRDEFLQRLTARADQSMKEEKAKITYGADGEQIVAEWKANGVGVRQMPDDPQGILRISIGGGDHLPVIVNYCTFRGSRGHCIDLLRKALQALEHGQDD